MPSREVFWNVPYGYVIELLGALAFVILLFSLYQRYKLWRMGRPEDRTKEMGKGWRFSFGRS